MIELTVDEEFEVLTYLNDKKPQGRTLLKYEENLILAVRRDLEWRLRVFKPKDVIDVTDFVYEKLTNPV